MKFFFSKLKEISSKKPEYNMRSLPNLFFTLVIFFNLVFINNDLKAVKTEGINLYEHAYHLERDYPIFAIPIYEQLLAGSIAKDVRRIASIRLYFLYSKYKKYPELLNLYSKYGSLVRLNKEHQANLHEMFRTYQISSSDFYKTYPLLVDPNNENISSILEILIETNSSKLLEFCYSILNYSSNYEALRTLLFYLPNSIAKPSLKLAVLAKSTDPNTGNLITEFLEDKEISNNDRSDAIYIYAQYLKALQYYDEAIENFNLSGSISNKERSLRESAKIYVSQGKISKACSLGKFAYNFSSESDNTLKLLCSGKTIKGTEKNLKIAWEILASREQSDFYGNAVKWLYTK
jgi:hypothetical protein